MARPWRVILSPQVFAITLARRLETSYIMKIVVEDTLRIVALTFARQGVIGGGSGLGAPADAVVAVTTSGSSSSSEPVAGQLPAQKPVEMAAVVVTGGGGGGIGVDVSGGAAAVGLRGRSSPAPTQPSRVIPGGSLGASQSSAATANITSSASPGRESGRRRGVPWAAAAGIRPPPHAEAPPPGADRPPKQGGEGATSSPAVLPAPQPALLSARAACEAKSLLLTQEQEEGGAADQGAQAALLAPSPALVRRPVRIVDEEETSSDDGDGSSKHLSSSSSKSCARITRSGGRGSGGSAVAVSADCVTYVLAPEVGAAQLTAGGSPSAKQSMGTTAGGELADFPSHPVAAVVAKSRAAPSSALAAVVASILTRAGRSAGSAASAAFARGARALSPRQGEDLQQQQPRAASLKHIAVVGLPPSSLDVVSATGGTTRRIPPLLVSTPASPVAEAGVS